MLEGLSIPPPSAAPPLELVIKRPEFQVKQPVVRRAVLAASYLLWFRFFGYSWVLQSHLNSVREAILGGRDLGTSTGVVLRWPTRNTSDPWLCLARVNGSIVPAAGVGDFVCLFAPADERTVAAELQLEGASAPFEPVREFPLNAVSVVVGPTALAFEDCLPVVPDHFLAKPENSKCLLFPPEGRQPQILTSVVGKPPHLEEPCVDVHQISHRGGLLIERNVIDRIRS